MRLLFLGVIAISLFGCSLDADKTVTAADQQMSDIMPMGESITAVRSFLKNEGFEFQEVSIEECDSFYLYPEYRCEGGPAIHLWLSDDAHPWAPLYSPPMYAFLAFDSGLVLSEIVVRFE